MEGVAKVQWGRGVAAEYAGLAGKHVLAYP